MKSALIPYSVKAFGEKIGANDTIILDTRRADKFLNGFVPGSVFIGLEGRFTEWAGIILPLDKDILLVAEPGLEEEVMTRLIRVGFSQVKGYLDGGFEAWKNAGEEVDMVINVEADELAMDIPFDDNMVVLDVRRATEYGDGHIAGSLNLPLDELIDPANMANFEDNQNIYIHCASGYRSVIAASLLKKQGIHNLRNVAGGWESIKDQKVEIVKENSVLN